MRKNYGTVIHIDPDFLWYLYNSPKINRKVEGSENAVRAYMRDYAGSGVTDALLCVFESCSVVPSEKWTWIGEKYLAKTENGHPVDYTKDVVYDLQNESGINTQKPGSVSHYLEPDYMFYEKGDYDPVAVILDEFTKNGINAWLSIRPNDAHCHMDVCEWIRSREFYEFCESGDVIYGNKIDYYDRCFDFASEKVRTRYLEYIKELVAKYDFYGLELDFQREMFCFSYWDGHSDEYCAIMTEFVEEVRDILNLRAKTLGHEIKLMVTLMREIDECKYMGFDARTWVQKGLVDVLSITPRWENTDSNIPIGAWAEMVKGTKTSIYAGLEVSLARTYIVNSPVFNDPETARGYAAAYYAAGAEKIYLSNFFTFCGREQHGFTPLANVWRGCSSPENAKSSRRRVVVTYTEDAMIPKGKEGYRPLPAKIQKESSLSLDVQTGALLQNESVTIYASYENEEQAEKTEVFFDGEKLEKGQMSFGAYCEGHIDGVVYRYFAPKKERSGNIRSVSFAAHSDAKIGYLELVIDNDK